MIVNRSYSVYNHVASGCEWYAYWENNVVSTLIQRHCVKWALIRVLLGCVCLMWLFFFNLRAPVMYVQTFAFKQLASVSSLLQKSLLTVNIKFHSPVVFFFTTIMFFFCCCFFFFFFFLFFLFFS